MNSGNRRTEYKTQFGERGYNPMKSMAERMIAQAPFPKSDDELKLDIA